MNLQITGGAGFLGTNLAMQLSYSQKYVIEVIDNLSREGSKENAKALGDITESDAAYYWNYENVVHLAGQVAVTKSVEAPRFDLDNNALLTVNILEQLRKHGGSIFYASTNKVYGYRPPIPCNEHSPLDPSDSPYALSKYAGDLYTQMYCKLYGLRGIVFRNSCIYGPHQWGIPGQAWLAWFITQALRDETLHIYGTGKQIRDVLYVRDWVIAVERALELLEEMPAGECEVFTIGGGPANAIDLNTAIELIGNILGKKLRTEYHEARPGDQIAYISDISNAKAVLDWEPKVGPYEGIAKLVEWVKATMEVAA